MVAFKFRVHWFADKFTKEEAFEMHTLCSNGVLAAIKENDLRAFFMYSLKEDAYQQVLTHKEHAYHIGNHMIEYPEDSDGAIELSWMYQHTFQMVAGC